MAWDLAEKLQAEELPHDEDELMARYTEGLKFVRIDFLAKSLTQNPEQADFLISEFQRGSVHSSIGFKQLGESFELVYGEQIRRNQEKRALFKIDGFERLSTSIGGFNPGRISMLTAKSGIGKTTLARNLCLGATASPFGKVLFFNMEMIEHDFVQGFIQIELDLTFEEWTKDAAAKIANLSLASKRIKNRKPLFYTDGKSLSLDQIVSSIFSQSSEAEVEPNFIVIDYDQKIQVTSKDEEWRYMVRTMERLEDVAKSTNSHILILAQGNDEGDPKASRRSIQPASAVLNLSLEEDGRHSITAIKNRFGAYKAKTFIDYVPEKGRIRESFNQMPFEREPSKFESIQRAFARPGQEKRNSHDNN
jgi:predicted ATP-dependent serine protease